MTHVAVKLLTRNSGGFLEPIRLVPRRGSYLCDARLLTKVFVQSSLSLMNRYYHWRKRLEISLAV